MERILNFAHGLQPCCWKEIQNACHLLYTRKILPSLIFIQMHCKMTSSNFKVALNHLSVLKHDELIQIWSLRLRTKWAEIKQGWNFPPIQYKGIKRVPLLEGVLHEEACYYGHGGGKTGSTHSFSLQSFFVCVCSYY